nr:ATP-binding protein [uncultured Desulfobacter sp.]
MILVKRKRIFVFAAVLYLFFSALQLSAAQENRTPLKVLILNSYHPGFSWSDDEETGVIEILKHLPSIDIPVEYFDAKRYPRKSNQLRMKTLLEEKYFGEKINLVIALDDAAVELVTKFHVELFPDTPVVFAGITGFSKYSVFGRKKITGVLETQDIKNTVDTILNLNPDTKEIACISDATVSGLSARKAMEAVVTEYTGRVAFRFLPPGTFEETQAMIAGLSDQSAILLNSYTTDSSGRALSTKESTRLILSGAGVPVYGVHQNRFGDGIIGGFLLSGREQGRQAAKMGLAILAGENPDAIPIRKTGTSIPMFDYRQMERFGIPLAKLPPGSIVIHEPESVFTTHRKFAFTITGILILLVIALLLLLLFMTRLIRAKAALQKSESKTRSILDNIGIGVSLISPEMCILELNKQMRQWFPDVNLLQQHACFRSFNDPPREDVCPGCPVVKSFQDGKVHQATLQTPRPEGIRNFRIVSSPVFGQSGEIWAVIEMVDDITEQISLEDQLRQAQKMESVGRLAGGVAHDFNNMIGVILGYGELALTKTGADHVAYRYIEKIMDAAQRSATIIRQLLAFARKQTISPRILDINATVDGITKILKRLIGEDIELVWRPGKGVWPVKMDPGQVDQILANLCINARDAIVNVGNITIETGNIEFDEAYTSRHMGFQPGEYVRLTVSDTGSGMDAETLNNIFEPFFTTKDAVKGTGLGLATVYGIVKQNNGFINVYSEPGQGSSFKIYLPRQKSLPDPLPIIKKETPVQHGQETILLVEDNLSFLKLAELMLQELGYRVLACRTPGDAIELVRGHQQKIHLLLTDVIMPEMNGRELFNNMQAVYPKLRHLFMSGYTANIISHHGVLDENVNFVAKPFSKKKLAAKVREALDKDV